LLRTNLTFALFAGQDDVEKAYKIGKELGSGNFAVVRVAIKRDTLEKLAIKIIDKKLCSGKEDMIQTELAVLHRVKHPHIVAMYEVFDTPDKLYVVLCCVVLFCFVLLTCFSCCLLLAALPLGTLCCST
jgi:serine/threonine protein kinase